MASALKLLKQQGYRRVRLEDIAADAGVSKATVYHYFDNKDDLLTRAVSERVAGRQAEVEALLARTGPSATERVRIYLRQFWEFSLTPHAGVWQRMLVSEIVTEAPRIFRAWAEGLVGRWKLLERLIKEGQARGEFAPDVDAAVAARLIVSGLSHQALFHEHFGVRKLAPCDLDRIFDGALEQFLTVLTHSQRRRVKPRPTSRRRAVGPTASSHSDSTALISR
jgi:AcrR family transcriptional regulator